jgi:hypothetical protein
MLADAATFESLPLLLAQRIFLALPADDRGRASCVCCAWRDALAEPSLWTRLDMSYVRGGYERHASVFRGAAGRAHGQLRYLKLVQQYVPWDALLSVLTANAGNLRELHLHTVAVRTFVRDLVTFAGVVAAAPLLQVLTAKETSCSWQDAPRMLRAEPPFAPLQMCGSLLAYFTGEDGLAGGMERFGPFAAALADAALQPALTQVFVGNADTAQPAVMGALADAAVARRLRELRLYSCTPPAAAPLARLLTEGSLAALVIGPSSDGDTPMFDPAGAALVADALRMNTTLKKLILARLRMCVDVRVAGALLGALVGHRSLRDLRFSDECTTVEHCGALGAALAAVIAADAPALHVLDCSHNRLRDAGLAPIVEALPLNRHLRELDLQGNGMSEAFAQEQLLPAVRANTTLLSLECVTFRHNMAATPVQAEAEELVRRRWQHD